MVTGIPGPTLTAVTLLEKSEQPLLCLRYYKASTYPGEAPPQKWKVIALLMTSGSGKERSD